MSLSFELCVTFLLVLGYKLHREVESYLNVYKFSGFIISYLKFPTFPWLARPQSNTESVSKGPLQPLGLDLVLRQTDYLDFQQSSLTSPKSQKSQVSQVSSNFVCSILAQGKCHSPYHQLQVSLDFRALKYLHIDSKISLRYMISFSLFPQKGTRQKLMNQS